MQSEPGWRRVALACLLMVVLAFQVLVVLVVVILRVLGVVVVDVGFLLVVVRRWVVLVVVVGVVLVEVGIHCVVVRVVGVRVRVHVVRVFHGHLSASSAYRQDLPPDHAPYFLRREVIGALGVRGLAAGGGALVPAVFVQLLLLLRGVDPRELRVEYGLDVIHRHVLVVLGHGLALRVAVVVRDAARRVAAAGAVRGVACPEGADLAHGQVAPAVSSCLADRGARDPPVGPSNFVHGHVVLVVGVVGQVGIVRLVGGGGRRRLPRGRWEPTR